MHLSLLGTFRATDNGADVVVAPNGARLLALLALNRGGLTRACVAGTLWPEKNEDRAGANLRSTLWRLKSTRTVAIAERDPTVLGLRPDVSVDLDELVSDIEADTRDVEPLLRPLLEDWHDPWVEIMRIRWRQVRLHALDQACEGLIARRCYAEAVDLAVRILEIEPLRESVVRLMIQAKLRLDDAEGALIAASSYEQRLRSDCSAVASPQLARLLEHAQVPRDPAFEGV